MLLVLAGVASLVAARLGSLAPGTDVRARIAAAASFDGVGYGLVGAKVSKTLAQRGAGPVSASGVFDVVKLRLQAVDGRPHVVSGDLVSLDARGTYYGVSSPADIGLSDTHWGLLWGPAAVPAQGSVTVKAVFDIPPAVLRRPLLLHIGPFDYVGQAPAVILRLPYRPSCCDTAPQAPGTGPASSLDGLVLG